MIQHPDKNFINPILVKIYDQPAYYAHVEEEADGKPWFHDIKEYLAKEKHLELANPIQKRTLRRLSNNFFHSGGILYRRTPDLGLLRCVDVKEASKLLEGIHVGTCGPDMNGFVLAKKILRAGKSSSNSRLSRSNPAPVPAALLDFNHPSQPEYLVRS
ncbi:uncharacterized protein [Nicotiana sylvestris]|uniref:uncharacterized protein n=1 Tax=Nicotiana sylvestris TaxID=4096 RepID=UPI00388C9C29